MTIPIAEAAMHVLITSPFKGRRIGDVGKDDAGLLELERLAAEERLGIVDPLDRMYIEAYVTDWKVAKDIERIKDRARARAIATA